MNVLSKPFPYIDKHFAFHFSDLFRGVSDRLSIYQSISRTFHIAKDMHTISY